MEVSSSGVYRGFDTLVDGGGGFHGFVDLGNTASQYNHIQLFNPAASGIIGVIDHITVSGANIQYFESAFHNTELTTDNGAGSSTINGGTAALCHLRSVTQTTQVGTLIDVYRNTTSAIFPLDFLVGYELLEGEGVLIRNLIVNDGLVVVFRWREF